MLVEAAREFARGELLQRDRAWDTGGANLSEVLPQLAEMGFMNRLCLAIGGGGPFRAQHGRDDPAALRAEGQAEGVAVALG